MTSTVDNLPIQRQERLELSWSTYHLPNQIILLCNRAKVGRNTLAIKLNLEVLKIIVDNKIVRLVFYLLFSV